MMDYHTVDLALALMKIEMIYDYNNHSSVEHFIYLSLFISSTLLVCSSLFTSISLKQSMDVTVFKTLYIKLSFIFIKCLYGSINLFVCTNLIVILEFPLHTQHWLLPSLNDLEVYVVPQCYMLLCANPWQPNFVVCRLVVFLFVMDLFFLSLPLSLHLHHIPKFLCLIHLDLLYHLLHFLTNDQTLSMF